MHDAAGAHEVVVGVDSSLAATAALGWAARYAALTGARLRVVHATDRVAVPAADPVGRGAAHLSYRQLTMDYHQLVHDVVDDLPVRPAWLVQVRDGRPDEVLLRAAEGADLLVVGTRADVGLNRLLFGSVSHACVSRGGCPVVAVPATAYAADSSRSESPPSTDATEVASTTKGH